MTRQSYEHIIKQILEVPVAPQIVAELRAQLAEEQKKRQTFYNEITEYEKAEFINGEIIIHSPVKKEHNYVSGNCYRLISTFVEQHELGYVGYEKIMISLSRNDYEPDICFFGKEKSKAFEEGQRLFPAPDLVIEVLSPKTAKNDRGIKFEDYEAHEIAEYWIIDPKKKVLEQYRMVDGRYELLLKSGQGPLDCSVLPNFVVDIRAFFDRHAHLEALKQLLA